MTAWVIIAIGIVGGAIASWLAIAKHGPVDPIDPTAEKRRLVRAVARHPRLAAFVVRRLDRTRAGGLLLTVGFVVVLSLAATAGAVFDLIDGALGGFDLAVAEWGAAQEGPAPFGLLALLTRLGGTAVITLVGLATAAYGWWRHRNPQVATFVLTVVAGQALVVAGLKAMVGRPRPELDQVVAWSGSSFPSGHSAAAAATYAAVALVLALGSPSWRKVVLAGAAGFLASAIAATRALLGVHWLTDVLAGLAIGWAWFVVSAVAFGGRIMKFGEPRDEVAATWDPVEARAS